MLSILLAHILLLGVVLGNVPANDVGHGGTLSLNLHPLMTLPEPEVTINHSTNYVNGMEWHYRIPHPKTGKIIEEFSIHLIDGGLVPETSEGVSRRTSNELVSLQPRANYVCEYIFGCAAAVSYQASISAAQISAAAARLGDDLSANGYAKAKSIAAGFIYQNAIGITSGIASWYITNKIQGQDVRAQDTCSSVDINNLANTIRQLQADIQDLGAKIQGGDSSPRGYDHYTLETTQQQEGAHLKHTVKPTRDSGDYYKISDCNIT